MAEEQNQASQSEQPGKVSHEASFFRIVETFGVGVLVSTGIIQNPVEKDAKPDLDVAKYQIGLLEILEDRTRGNLKEGEAQFLEEWLHQVRMAYVQATKKVEEEGAKKKTETPASGEGEKKEG